MSLHVNKKDKRVRYVSILDNIDTEKIFITGEVTSKSQVDVSSITKRVLRDIGYNDNYEIINNLNKSYILRRM